MAKQKEKRDYRQEVANELIEAMEKGNAPFQQAWDANKISAMPFNPITENNYKGINNIYLEAKAVNRGYEDPRWLTYKQSAELGGQVRKGEKSTPIEYWKWTQKIDAVDDQGKPILDDEGKQKTFMQRLERPQVFHANLFNGEQIDGLPKYHAPPPSFTPIEKAEAMIASMNVEIKHVGDKAFYSPQNHHIRMPPKESFKDQYAYYSTVLHELGHSTGHKDILARDLSGGFGSESYAKEELRAEMASYMIAHETGIGHDPSSHASYLQSWLKVLKDDKNEIFRASRDAEIIKTFIAEPEKRPALIEQAQASKAVKAIDRQEARQDAGQDAGQAERQEDKEMTDAQAIKKHYFHVPFTEKDEAKKKRCKMG